MTTTGEDVERRLKALADGERIGLYGLGAVVVTSFAAVVFGVVVGPPNSKLGMALIAGVPFVLLAVTAICVIGMRIERELCRTELSQERLRGLSATAVDDRLDMNEVDQPADQPSSLVESNIQAARLETARLRAADTHLGIMATIMRQQDDAAHGALEQERAALGFILYRLYNYEMSLLYIGITNNINRRLQQHAANKPWWDKVVPMFTRLEYLSSRAELEAVERLAIVRERPRYNVIHGQVVTP